MTLESHLAEFHEIISGPGNRFIDRWKGTGGGVIGYFCSYVPVEILTAAGFLPVRFRGAGSRDSSSADVYLSSRICTYVRHALSLGLEGGYDFLDGEISLNTCDHVKRAFDLWRHKTAVPFHGFLSVPRNVRETLYPYYREEVGNLAESIESCFSVQITKESLLEAIRLHNETRRLLSSLDELCSRAEPALSGAAKLAVSVASTVMPARDFKKMAEKLLMALETEKQAGSKPRARLLLAGGELDEPAFVAAIESQGAAVVADTLCFGARGNDTLVDEEASDPMDALCRRYFFKVSCARMIGNFPDRFDYILETIKKHRIDGVVFQRLKFCDPWGGEAHNLGRRCRKHGIPVLFLDREYGHPHTGQVGTRVQAFIEMIESMARRNGAGQGCQD